MNKQLGAQLLKKYLSGLATQKEQHIVEEWYAFNRMGEPAIDSPEDFMRIKSEMWATIDYRSRIQVKTMQKRRWLSYAAAVLVLMCAVGIYKWLLPQKEYNVINYAGPEIKAGHTGATLTLSDGTEIDLNSVDAGLITSGYGVRVSKNAQGALVYTEERDTHKAPDNITNTVTTRNGEIFEVVLPDGSRVWLNSASSLTFKSDLAKNSTRTVKLRGEGYFEVRKNRRPFIVATESQEVHVLGTHFNINAYAESKGLVKTTLLEGVVNVVTGKSEQKISPGEQAVNKMGQIDVHLQDTEDILAWKNGYFKIDGNIYEIMLSIGRWYDVDVQFTETVPKELKLWGYISRSNDLITTLRQIERTNKVKFKIKERTITVTN
ncbi:FecR family protein [Sphingobacterium thalpophilum]|uniref:Fec operon regulator FecR n=1 Tax=Sphingobacterium thalpophilum TaxID=259 RepID=A0A4U9VYV0_9SPHI|nr:FecR family protein [Sphingobacterium thalpophilum]VTR48994.1 fec operon regulator FecR [Sphingobacterium thalpophilum]